MFSIGSASILAFLVSMMSTPISISSTNTSMSTTKNSGDNGAGTIRHCVFIHFKPEISQHEKDAIYAEIDGLKNHVDGILKVMSGKNVDPKSRDHGFADGFIVDFVNSAVRDEYLENAEHKKVGAKIVAAAEGGPKGIFVFDLQL